MRKKRYYLIDENGKELGPVFKGTRPSQAATKAATRIIEEPGERTEIRLLNKKDKKIYVYEVTLEEVEAKVPWKDGTAKVRRGKIIERKDIVKVE